MEHTIFHTSHYENIDVRNPAELAYPYAAGLMNKRSFDDLSRSDTEELMVKQLHQAVGILGLRGTYVVGAGKAWAREPVFIGQRQSVDELNQIEFEGNFFLHDVVKMNGAYSDHKIRALCLAFNDVELLPDRDRLPDHIFMYVPVFAVDDIIRIK